MMSFPTQTNHGVTFGCCPECGCSIRMVLSLRIGCLLQCSNCREILIVRHVHPVELDWAFEEPDREHLTGSDV